MTDHTVNDIYIDARNTFDKFAAEKGMSSNDAFSYILNVNYYKKKDPAYDTKGMSNPMIIGNYVYKNVGHRDYYLQARKKLETDTPDALIKMADVTDDVYIDQENNKSYCTIMSFNDR